MMFPRECLREAERHLYGLSAQFRQPDYVYFHFPPNVQYLVSLL